MWLDLGKSTVLSQPVKLLLLLHIIDTFICYSKHSDNITRGGQVCFSTRLFRHRVKHWKASTDGGGPLGCCNWTAWTHIVSYKLASSSVVICDWCGGMFGIWLELGVPLGVYFLIDNLLPLPHPHRLPPPTRPYKRQSWYYSRASKSHPKSSRTNYQRWLSLSTWS